MGIDDHYYLIIICVHLRASSEAGGFMYLTMSFPMDQQCHSREGGNPGVNSMMYIGVTSNLVKRMYEHKEGLLEGFTKKYKVKDLVYYEQANDVNEAIIREKQLKKWNRQWKINLIEKENPGWLDLFDGLL